MRRWLIVGVLLLAQVAVACGGSGEEDPSPATSTKANLPANPPFKARVEITKDGYRPRHVRILLGGSVTFVNVDPDGVHTAETGPIDEGASDSNEFDTHTLLWEEPYTITFHKPGIVEYTSSFDGWMKGTVEVVPKI